MYLNKKKKKKFLTVNDYIHLPDKNILSSIENELKGFYLFYIFILRFINGHSFLITLIGHISSIENMVKNSIYETEENFLTRIKTQTIKVNFDKENKVSFETIPTLMKGELDDSLNLNE